MQENIKILIADGVPETRKSMRQILSAEHKFDIVGECNDGEVAVKLSLELKPDIVLMDMNLFGLDGLIAADILASIAPNVLVIITSIKGGQPNIKKAMASGARDFILKPFAGNAVVDSIIALYDKHKKNINMIEKKDFKKIDIKPKIIMIFSTKGGVGKTVISTNLAVYLAQKTGEGVALLDFDFEFGDIPVMLNLHPQNTVAGLIKEIKNLSPDLIEEYFIEHPSGVKILPAPLSPELAGNITSEHAQKIIRTITENYKYIVIDTSPTFNDVNLAVLDMADQIFFITTTDLSTIKNIKSGLEVLKALKYEQSKIGIVLNRYNSKFGITNQDLENTIGKQILHIVPEDTDIVVNAINKGVPFVIEHSNSSVGKSIIEMGNSIIGNKDSSGYKYEFFLSFLKRIFNSW